MTFETAVNLEAPAIRQQSHEMEKHVILATIRMTIPLRKCDNVLKLISSLSEKNRKASGCLSIHLYKDLLENNTFLLEEVWRTEDDLHLHIRSEEYHNLLLILEMALTEPEIKFNTISRWTSKNGERDVIPSLLVDERNEATMYGSSTLGRSCPDPMAADGMTPLI